MPSVKGDAFRRGVRGFTVFPTGTIKKPTQIRSLGRGLLLGSVPGELISLNARQIVKALFSHYKWELGKKQKKLKKENKGFGRKNAGFSGKEGRPVFAPYQAAEG